LYELDHVALAARDTAPALQFLTGTLGGTVMFGGRAFGYQPMQVWIGDQSGDGMSIELLEPWDVEHNDFLARFVDKRGDGPHHMTFKVPDLTDALARVRDFGATPVKIDVSDPSWKEAFIMPGEAHGTVVQLAETTHNVGRADLLAHIAQHGPDGHPRWWTDPSPHAGPVARLQRVVLRTARLDDALAFFRDLLLGEVEGRRDDRVELVWPNGSRIAIELDAGAAPGVDRLEVEGLAAPTELIGTRFVPAGSSVVGSSR
jgi:catechol 2,3-dioxygenase-like lactoylglutathione lyase family enzyme